MERKERLQQRLSEIAESLKTSENALALMGLGSAGQEVHRMDNYSDLDFFAIVRDGYKQRYIENTDWLERIRPVVFKFRNTRDGYKIMFDDGIYCEFAVFETPELADIPYAPGRIIWKDEGFDTKLSIPQHTGAPDWKPESIEWLLGEIITNIYVGVCRYYRGEKLAAYRGVQGNAFNLFIELIALSCAADEKVCRDIYSKERRFEQRYPGMEPVLARILPGYEHRVNAARAMLIYLDENYSINRYMRTLILNICENGIE